MTQGQSNYRVMLLRANGEIALVCLSRSLKKANQIARALREKHLKRLKADWSRIIRRDDRPRMVYIEAWQGSPTGGAWHLLRRGGFRFEFHDWRRGAQDLAKGSLKTGGIFDCILLSEKTRKGGWRARIVDSDLLGPVTNWQEIPGHHMAGDRVALKLCGASHHSKIVQLAVPHEAAVKRLKTQKQHKQN